MSLRSRIYQDNNFQAGLIVRNQYTSGFNKNASIDFSVSNLSYDANGNILSQTQKGWKITGSTYIDQLSYAYTANTNKLQAVTDASNDNSSVLGDFKYDAASKTSTDYTYDSNGNLTADNNKKISSISYNHLNLPSSITVTSKGTIAYTYDPAGNKLKKVTTEGTKVTTTLYMFGTYINDTLQFLPHEDGRIRPITGGFTYDYFLKDHLGNVRMVLTEEAKQDVYPAATLEGDLNTSTDAAYIEKQYYSINSANVVAQTDASGISTYQNNNGNPPYNNNPNSNTTANSAKLYKLTASGSGGVTGLGMALKVMSGDRIDIFGKSYYNQANSGGSNYSIPVIDILNGLFGSPSGVVTGKGVSASDVNNVSATNTNISNFLSNTGRNSGTTPKAAINWILLDDNFMYVTGGFSNVGTSGSVKSHGSELSNISVTKNGYLYVYVSNQSPVSIYFDNLQVIHTRGQILEETLYYPFGLSMSGISTSAAGNLKNKYKFGGKELQSNEFTDNSGLELYDFSARNYDPQVGRFWSGDRKADKLVQWSPYTYAVNNPILFVDPDGEYPYPVHIRAFIPSPTLSFLGSTYSGDGRGYSTTLSKRELGTRGVTSRMQQTFIVDPSKATMTGGAPWSDPTYSGRKTATANPEGSASAIFGCSPTQNTATISADMASSNPLFPIKKIAADIDVKSSLRLTENLEKGILSVDASMAGDKYPAAEMFIGDTKGQQLSIITSPFEGSPMNLPGNNNRPMGSAKFDININGKGEFMGVTVGSGKDTKTYSVVEWNKRMQSVPLEVKSTAVPINPPGRSGGFVF